tara:strand:+ start:224 stop:559 length:336 start_codon:yes stop_codon:yes gene_type:complete
MTVTKTWEINTLERDLSDGFVTEVIYRCKGIDNDDNKEKARATGSIQLTKPSSLPSDFIAYNSLTNSIVLNWVKTILDAQNAGTVASIEAKLEEDVNLAKTPIKATGKPWT